MFISEEVLKKLPIGKLVKTELIKDMNGHRRPALLWRFMDSFEVRESYFAVYNGEYLGEAGFQVEKSLVKRPKG